MLQATHDFKGDKGTHDYHILIIPALTCFLVLFTQCESVVEDHEEDFLSAFAEDNNEKVQNKICSALCKNIDKSKKSKTTAKEEL